MTIAGLFLLLTACGEKEPTEFKIQLFCRGDAESCTAPDCVQGQEATSKALSDNAAEGWRYVGPLSDNGMNCRYIAFGR